MLIAQVTFNTYNNYGNVLQAYALNRVLKKIGFETEYLWLEKNKFRPLMSNNTVKTLIKIAINWHGYRDSFMANEYGWEMVRQANVRRFMQKHVKQRFVGEREKGQLSEEYDYFLVGSDQVWNPYFFKDRCRDNFLTFAPSGKRISYAASIDVSELPIQDRINFTKWLGEMHNISMREQLGVEIVKELTGRDVLLHIDPTMLLTSEEWTNMEECPLWLTEGEKYVVTYFLGERPLIAEEIAHKQGLKIIHILDKKVFDHYVVSPEEFIYLLHHAELVYTDSFHGTVFSILFRKAFVVCDRVQQRQCDMTSRIDTLMNLFEISGHRGNDTNNFAVDRPFDAVYMDVDMVLENERKRSYEYLKDALKKD